MTHTEIRAVKPIRLVAFVAALALPIALHAQDSLALAGLRWREVGPFRGGRSVAATGNPSRENEFWMGTTGGGVFKSINAGQSWAPVTDKYFGGTIGAIDVAPRRPTSYMSAAAVRFAATCRTATASGNDRRGKT